jgi:hypothetical protein
MLLRLAAGPGGELADFADFAQPVLLLLIASRTGPASGSPYQDRHRCRQPR